MYDGDLKVGDKILVDSDSTSCPFRKATVKAVSLSNDRATITSTDIRGYSSWSIARRSDGGWGCDGNNGNIKMDEPETKMTTDKVTLKTVVIPGEKTAQILSAISQQKNAIKIFEEWGFADIFEKGVAVTLLFWGIPGTGKTLTAQAIATELKMKLEVFQTADIETSEPGGAERNIRNIFQKCKGKKVIILFDECDSLLMDRNEVGPIMGAQVNALLTEIEKYDGVIVFTTNRMGKLDPALERRITTKVEFPFPDSISREAIWKRMIPKKCPLNKDVDYEKLAEYPLTGGNIKNAVLNAARSAAYLEAKELTMQDFVQAIEKELESIQSFAAEYEKQIHQRNVTHDLHRTETGTRVEKKRTIEKKESPIRKIEGTLDRLSDSKQQELLKELEK